MECYMSQPEQKKTTSRKSRGLVSEARVTHSVSRLSPLAEDTHIFLRLTANQSLITLIRPHSCSALLEDLIPSTTASEWNRSCSLLSWSCTLSLSIFGTVHIYVGVGRSPNHGVRGSHLVSGLSKMCVGSTLPPTQSCSD